MGTETYTYDMRGINLKYAALFTILFGLAWWFIPSTQTTRLSLTSVDGRVVFNENLFQDTSPRNSLQLVVSGIVGTTLNMDWYDVCLKNDSQVETGNLTFPTMREFRFIGTTTTERFTMFLMLLPIQKNISLLDAQSFKKEFDFTLHDTTQSGRSIYTSSLVAEPGATSCVPVLINDGGFLYASPAIFNNTGLLYTINTTGTSTLLEANGEGEIGKVFQLGNSVLEVRTNYLALWLKRFTLWLILCSMVLLLAEIRSRIFSKLVTK